MNATIATRVKLGVTLVCTAILAYVLWVSRDHITDTAYMIGLEGYQAETLFILIDIVAMIGRVLNTKYFAKSTQKIGFKLMLSAGSLSLVCNVIAGHNLGQRVYGVFIVVLFVVLESVVTRIKPAASVTRAANKAAAAAPTAPAAPKPTTAKCAAGCTCGKHSRTRAPKVPAAAPVSPGPLGNGPAGPSAAQLEEMVNTPAYI